MRAYHRVASILFLCLCSCSKIAADAGAHIEQGMDKLAKGLVDGADALDPAAIKRIFEAYRGAMSANRSLEYALQQAQGQLDLERNAETTLYLIVPTIEPGCQVRVTAVGDDKQHSVMEYINTTDETSNLPQPSGVSSRIMSLLGPNPKLTWEFSAPSKPRAGGEDTYTLEITEVRRSGERLSYPFTAVAKCNSEGEWNFVKGNSSGEIPLGSSK